MIVPFWLQRMMTIWLSYFLPHPSLCMCVPPLSVVNMASFLSGIYLSPRSAWLAYRHHAGIWHHRSIFDVYYVHTFWSSATHREMELCRKKTCSITRASAREGKTDLKKPHFSIISTARKVHKKSRQTSFLGPRMPRKKSLFLSSSSSSFV